MASTFVGGNPATFNITTASGTTETVAVPQGAAKKLIVFSGTFAGATVEIFLTAKLARDGKVQGVAITEDSAVTLDTGNSAKINFAWTGGTGATNVNIDMLA